MNYSFIALLFPLLFVFPAINGLHAQDITTALAAIKQAELSYPQTMLALDCAGESAIGTLDRYFKKSVSNAITQAFLKKRRLAPCYIGVPYTPWCITYADGFQAYNSFRPYRTVARVAVYYLGHGGGGSWYYQDGKRVKGKLTYRTTQAALYMFQLHGKIVDISFYKKGQWSSVQTSSLHTGRSDNN